MEAPASLVRVTETGSFSAVARECDVSKAAVARQISYLEQHFEVRLPHRTTRKLSLTDRGQMLLGLTGTVLDGIESIEAALGQQSASAVGLVRVGIMVAASHFLAPRLPALLAGRPELRRRTVAQTRWVVNGLSGTTRTECGRRAPAPGGPATTNWRARSIVKAWLSAAYVSGWAAVRACRPR